jgi:hypothetical protein
MGRMHGYIRGKTKLETYKRFRAQVDQKAIEDGTGLTMDAGTGGKIELYKEMQKDSETGEWVLFYHFGK